MIDRVYEYEPFWGNWYVDSFIGEGSFGKVYKIKRNEFGNTHYAALKMISIPKSDGEIKQAYYDGLDEESASIYFQGIVDELYKEINLMAQLKGSSNIVSYEDHMINTRDNGIGYDMLIRMELVESLNEHFLHKRYETSDIVKLGIDMCKALEMCQMVNVIHRDIKPDNIFVSSYGDYKLGDFGIARKLEVTNFGFSKKGTYTYMAPEVFKGESYDGRADLYSLGILMYRFLNNNRTPFSPQVNRIITHSEKEIALQRRMSGEEFPMPSQVGDALGRIILKACAYEQIDRFQSPQDFRRELENIVQEDIGLILRNQYQMQQNNQIGETVLLSQMNPIGMQQGNDIGETVVLSQMNPMGMQQGNNIGETVVLSQMDLMGMQPNNDIGETVLLSQMNPMGGQPNNDIGETVLLSERYPIESENTVDFSEMPDPTYPNSEEKKRKIFMPIKILAMVFAVLLCIFAIGMKIRSIRIENQKVETAARLAEEKRAAAEIEEVRAAEQKRMEEEIKKAEEERKAAIITKSNLDLKKLSSISNLNKAVELDVSKNAISDITDLSQCVNLEILYLNENKVSDVKALAALTKLNMLELSDNKIKDITSLSTLTGLSSLSMENNKVSDVSSLGTLTDLVNLNLKDNRIKDIAKLAGLIKVETINIADNEIQDIAIIANMSNLTIFHGENNKIKDISCLYELKSLSEVYLKGNKVSEKQIKKLQKLNPEIYIEYK